VPEGKAVFSVSPVLLMKDRKSGIEAQGMQNSHIRDAVALCQFLSMLEEGVSYNKFNSLNTCIITYNKSHVNVLELQYISKKLIEM
jgi:hypothetical protein